LGTNAPQVIEAVEAKRLEVLAWWQSFKVRQQRLVKELIGRSFVRAHGGLSDGAA
jgi:hypothetical protein